MLQSALFASWFSFGVPAILWLHMNSGSWLSSPRKMALTGMNFGIICISMTLVGFPFFHSALDTL